MHEKWKNKNISLKLHYVIFVLCLNKLNNQTFFAFMAE